MLKIKTLDNGWILEGEGMEGKIKEGFIYDEEYDVAKNGLRKLTALQDLFYAIKNALGEFGSKHDPYRLFIEIRDQEGKEVE